MSDDEVVAKAQSLLRSISVFVTDEDRARMVVHAVGPYIVADHLRALAKRYTSRFPLVARDMNEEADRLDRRGRMVEPT